jgi:hypothetical protein
MFEKVKIWLNPLVVALCGLITAATVYLNEGRDNVAESVHADFDKRLTIVEGNVSELKTLREELRVLNNNITIVLTKMEMFHGGK